MKKGLKLSIRTNIFISVLSLTLAMIIVLWVLQGIFFSSLYKNVKENDIDRASNLIVDNVGNDNLPELIGQVSLEYDLCLKVVDCSDYSLSYSAECTGNDCLIHKLLDDKNLFIYWFNEANNNDGSFSEIVSNDKFDEYNSSEFDGRVPDSSRRSLISIRLVSDSEGDVYMLVLNSSVEPIDAMVRAVRTLLAIITVLLVVFALLISFLLSRRISSPLVNMNKKAKNLAHADYDVTFTEEGPKETCELAKTLNVTAKELGKLDSMQKELIANISHDLRTPLTMISGYAEVMRDIPSENTPENLQVIVDETARLTSLVNDLLSVSKLQAGTQAMNIQRMNLTKAVLNTVERYARFKEHNDFTINFIYDETVYINADEIRLLQVIYNLINNAINYTGADKTVTVTQTVENGIVRISVTDTGEGIKEEDLPLIWDRYYKVDKIHKRAVIGTGLGLSIVKNILLLHGSRFGVSSELKKGSTFWFEFKIPTDE